MAPGLAGAATRDATPLPASQLCAGGAVLAVLPADVILTATGNDRPFFSLRSFEADRLRREIETAGTGDDFKGCVRRIAAVPLAWTGVFLSLRETVETTCPQEAHPAGESRFVTFVVGAAADGKPEARPVPLTEWLDATAVFQSLRKEPLTRKALAASRARPGALDELVTAVAASPPVVHGGEGKSCYAFPDDLLHRFAPSHVDGGKLAVRIGLPGAAVCRNRLTEIGIVVPLPRALAPAISQAAAGRAGFLKRNAPREFTKRPARIELSP